MTVVVPAKNIDVLLIARAGDIVGTVSTVHFSFTNQDEVAKPKLYVLAVGVADYVDPDLRLGLAGKAAIDFASAFKAQEGGLYATAETKLLVDRDAIMEGLDWLDHATTSHDVAILFLAGHAMTDKADTFWFLPADATAANLHSRGVSQDDLRRTLQTLAGKTVLFIDACHAAKGSGIVAGSVTRGSVDINSLINDFTASENGIVTFASLMGRELSQENVVWGNGALTKAVVEGIELGRAEHGHGTTTLSGLDEYIVDRVKEQTGGTQHPVTTRPPTISNFALALTKH